MAEARVAAAPQVGSRRAQLERAWQTAPKSDRQAALGPRVSRDWDGNGLCLYLIGGQLMR